MEISSVLFFISALPYLGGAILYFRALSCSCEARLRTAAAMAAAGLTLNGAAVIAHSVERGLSPFGTVYESFVLVVWALAAIYLFMERGRRIPVMGALVSLTAGYAALWGALYLERIAPYEHPALSSNWKIVHVSSTLLSYAGFAIAFCAAVGYIVQERALKSKKLGRAQRMLPPLDVMDGLAYRMVSFSFPMLTLGIITGAMWAQTAWGSYWDWDPKETWSAITWLVYAAYLHVRILQGWRGKWANRLLIAGFLCLAVTWLGVTFFTSGKHTVFGP